MKKKVIFAIFSLLILITAVVFIIGSISSYHYEAANDDILVGLGAGITLMAGAFVVFYELDLFYTVYYFFIKPKTLTKSILNILSNLSLLLVFFADCYKDIFKEDVVAPLLVILTYILLRIAYFIVSTRTLTQKQ